MGELLDGASSPHGGDGSAAGTAPGSPEPTPAAPALPPHLEPVRVAAVQESRRLATRFPALAPSFHDPASDDFDEDAAATELPRTLERLGSGEFPAAWYERILRRTRHLNPGQMEVVDAAASHWPATITTEQFHHRLSRLLGSLESQQETPAHLTPEGRRRVEL